MKDFLHLFTPVTEVLPKRFGGYFVITATGFATKAMYSHGQWSIHIIQVIEILICILIVII